MGLISRDGIIPITADQDTAGPLARTVTDAAIVLGVIAGFDPKDPATAACLTPGNCFRDYTRFLDAHALVGARIAVPPFPPNRAAVMNNAIDVLRAHGATVDLVPALAAQLPRVPVAASGGELSAGARLLNGAERRLQARSEQVVRGPRAINDADGRYTIETIRPGHDADVNPPPPAHIHVHLAADWMPNHWIDSFVFADDPLANRAVVDKNVALGRFSAALTLTRKRDGVMLASRDIIADPAVAVRNRLADGWYR